MTSAEIKVKAEVADGDMNLLEEKEEAQNIDLDKKEEKEQIVPTPSIRVDFPISTANTFSSASSSSIPKKKKARCRAKANNNTTTTTTTTKPPSQICTPLSSPTTNIMTSLPLLICSLGNPGTLYANTLHSAGHTVLLSLSSLLQTPQFSKDHSYSNALMTRSHNPETPWTLYQSPLYMNESGKAIASAFRTWTRESSFPGAVKGRLVVVHDELEKPLGSVSVRDKEGLSAKGHNGMKSCLASLGATRFVRVGVGIGRPVSREPDDVARFVLRKMTPGERSKIEGAAEVVLRKLMAI